MDSPTQNEVLLILTPSQKVATNELILQKILNFTSLNDLTKTRLVNYQWKEMSSRIVSRRKPLLKFIFDFPANEYKASLGFLTSFNSLLTSQDSSTDNSSSSGASYQFFWDKFHFSGGTLTTPGLSNFVLIHGHSVKKLELSSPPNVIIDYAEYLQSLRHLIIEGLPNLTHLTFDETLFATCIRDMWHRQADFYPFFTSEDVEIILTNLTEINLSLFTPPRVLLDLLGAAVNLNRSTNVTLSLIPQFVMKDKVHTIKHFDFILPEYLNHFTTLSQFSSHSSKNNCKGGVQLEKINFDIQYFAQQPENYPQVTAGLNKILKSSAKTLKVIMHLEDLSLLIPHGIEIGLYVMENVETLVFGFVPQGCLMIPPEFQIPKMFPNLRYVEVIEMHEWNVDLWVHFFEDEENGEMRILKSVRKLKLEFDCAQALVIEKFVQSMPNLDILDISVSKGEEMAGVMEDLWSFLKGKRIREIVINILNCSIMEDDFCLMMDAAVTGLAVQMCRKLRGKIEIEESSLVDLEGCERKNSILDLKELRSLKMNFVNFGQSGGDCEEDVQYLFNPIEIETNFQVFSGVSGIYGWNLVRPFLQVSISAPNAMESHFSCISPHISLSFI